MTKQTHVERSEDSVRLVLKPLGKTFCLTKCTNNKKLKEKLSIYIEAYKSCSLVHMTHALCLKRNTVVLK